MLTKIKPRYNQKRNDCYRGFNREIKRFDIAFPFQIHARLEPTERSAVRGQGTDGEIQPRCPKLASRPVNRSSSRRSFFVGRPVPRSLAMTGK